jgi:predicted transcriptional regulator
VHKTTIYLPDELKESLSNLARATGSSEAEIIREAIRARVRPPRPRAAIFASTVLTAADCDQALAGFGER